MAATSLHREEDEMTLEELVTTNPLPQVAKITAGWKDPNDPENSFSNGDVIEVCAFICNFKSNRISLSWAYTVGLAVKHTCR